MKEKIKVSDYAERIVTTLPKGILLNTQAEKFDSMVIGWGHLGTLWGRPTFVVYVRESRYTKEQLDRTGEFTISVPLEEIDPAVNRICGSMSGRDTDKAQEARLTLEDAEVIRTPGIREYPLTLECRVIYRQPQDISLLPEEIRAQAYSQGDPHTTYVGEIVDAYIIR